MDFEYDPQKDAANRAKHGVPLALGVSVLENCVGEIVDDRRAYGEIRINAFGLVETGCSSAPTRCAAKPTG